MNSLAISVSEFCAAHVGETVKGNALHAHVTKYHPDIAPDTPIRVLRSLREQGIVSYRVGQRSKGEYLILSVN